jgi:hypothetical protein
VIKSWCAAAKRNPSLPSLKRLLRAYRAACHYGDADAEEEVGG